MNRIQQFNNDWTFEAAGKRAYRINELYRYTDDDFYNERFSTYTEYISKESVRINRFVPYSHDDLDSDLE